jgi:hypothetical protein
MPKNKIEDLRNHLFASLEALSDEELMSNAEERSKAIEIANAKSALAKEINTTAALELKFANMHGETTSGFYSINEKNT